MRLYPKKLRGIDDLEREKKLLQKESKRMREEGFLPAGDLFKKPGEEDGGIASLLDLIPVSSPLAGIVMQFVKQKLSQKKNNIKAEDAARGTKGKPAGNPLKAIAVEFIGGYLKWKAIEFSYKGVRLLIKKRREKKNAGQ